MQIFFLWFIIFAAVLFVVGFGSFILFTRGERDGAYLPEYPDEYIELGGDDEKFKINVPLPTDKSTAFNHMEHEQIK